MTTDERLSIIEQLCLITGYRRASMKLNPMTIYKGSWNDTMEPKTYERLTKENEQLRCENDELKKIMKRQEALRAIQFVLAFVMVISAVVIVFG